MLEYGKSGIYNNNRLPAEKKKEEKENTRDRSVPDGSDKDVVNKEDDKMGNARTSLVPQPTCHFSKSDGDPG